jgi:hypothetical protein
MKRERLGWIVAALLIVVIAAGAMQQQPGQVGRYQLFQGHYNHNTVERPSVFRIDTQTGDVCEFISDTKTDGTLIEGWHPIRQPARRE